MRFNLSEWALKNRSVVIYLMIVAVAPGLFAFIRLGRNEDPAFVIKTMVVSAAWPGATMEDTLKQVTERLERKLEETPGLDFLRSYTKRRRHHDLRQSEGQRAGARGAGHLVPGPQEHRRHASDPARRASSVPSSTTSSATRSATSTASPPTASPSASCAIASRTSARKLLQRAGRLEDRDHRRAGRADLRRVLDAGTRQSRHRPQRAAGRAAGPERVPPGRRRSRPATRGSPCASPALSTPSRTSLNINFPVGDRMVRLGDIATVRRGYRRSAAADVPRQRQEGDRPRHRHARGGDILALGRNIKAAMAAITAELPLGIEPASSPTRPSRSTTPSPTS